MEYSLKDLVDIQLFQQLQDRLNELYSFPSAIIDHEGNILTATAWQDVCTKFHRCHPELAKECIKSDKYLIEGITDGNSLSFYKCPQGLVDFATPIIVEGQHLGAFFTGQCFLETPDLERYRSKAKEFGFDEEAYTAAIAKVPVVSHEQFAKISSVTTSFTEILAGIGFNNLKETEARKTIEQKESQYTALLESSMDGFWEVDNMGIIRNVNRTACEILGYSREEMTGMKVSEIEAIETPDDVLLHIDKVKRHKTERFETRHRKKNGEVIDVEISLTFLPHHEGRTYCFVRDLSAQKLAQAAEKQSDEFFKNFANDIPGYICAYLPDFTLIYCNDAVSEVAGITAEQLIGQNFFNFVSPEQAKIIRERLSQLTPENPSEFHEQSRPAPDGTTITEEWRNRAIFDENGNLDRFLAVGMDITERKRAEAAMLQNEERFNQVAECAGVWIWEVDATGLYTYISPQEETILGYQPEELVGKAHFFDLYDNNQREELKQTILDIFSKNESIRRFVNPCIHKDGHIVILETSGLPILDQHGNLLGYRGTKIDVTQREITNDILKASEEKFATVFKNAPVLLTITDLETGRFIDVNNNFVETSGFSREEVIGKTSVEVRWISEASRLVLREAFKRQVKVTELEFRVNKKNGDPINCLYNGELINIEGKTCALSLALDISDRKQAEEKIFKSNRLYMVTSKINQAIVHFRDKNELLREVCNIVIDYGKFQMSWIGSVNPETRMVEPIVHAGAELGYLSKINQITFDSKPTGMGPTGSAVREGKYVVCNDIEHDPRVALWRNEALRRNYRSSIALPLKPFGAIPLALTIYSSTTGFFDQQEISLLLELAENISFALEAFELENDRRKAREDLEKAENHYRALIEKAPDGIALINGNGDFTFVSPAVKKDYGYTSDSLEKTNPAMLTHPDDLANVLPEIMKVMADPAYIPTLQYRFRTAGGQWRWVESTFSNLLSDPDIQAVVINFRDISDRKKAEFELIAAKEVAEESIRLKSAFLNNMSHEIRTPMNAIMGFSNLMQESDPAEMGYFAGIIQKSSKQLLMLIDDVVLLSRLQSEKLPLNKVGFSPAELVTDVFEMFNLPEIHNGLAIQVRIPAGYRDLTIKADLGKIKQVLTIFASNAVKYTFDGSVEVGFEKEKDNLVFYVKDTGIGIPETEQKRVFETFYRGEQVIASAIRGTGLGLNIAKELVELLGGTVGLESRPGAGSKFFFSIPIELSENQTHKDTEEKTPQKSCSDYTILIAEDEPANFQYLEILLRKQVKKIDHAMNGQEAIDMASKTSYDLIFMDLKMPIIGGVEATRALRGKFPELKIIAQTAYSQPEEKEIAMSAGCNDYIVKPIRKADLLEILNKYGK